MSKMEHQDRCKSRYKATEMSKIREKMENPMPVEWAIGRNQNNMKNYVDLQPIARSIKDPFWVRGERLSFGILAEHKYDFFLLNLTYRIRPMICHLCELKYKPRLSTFGNMGRDKVTPVIQIT